MTPDREKQAFFFPPREPQEKFLISSFSIFLCDFFFTIVRLERIHFFFSLSHAKRCMMLYFFFQLETEMALLQMRYLRPHEAFYMTEDKSRELYGFQKQPCLVVASFFLDHVQIGTYRFLTRLRRRALCIVQQKWGNIDMKSDKLQWMFI